jgi:hypothetical protein
VPKVSLLEGVADPEVVECCQTAVVEAEEALRKMYRQTVFP